MTPAAPNPDDRAETTTAPEPTSDARTDYSADVIPPPARCGTMLLSIRALFGASPADDTQR